MSLLSHAVVILCIVNKCVCIWPPEVEVKLQQDEEFVISEVVDEKEFQDVYDEDELIQEPKSLNNQKYFGLHDLVERRNAFVDGAELKGRFPESVPLSEPQPWIAGFVDNESGEIRKDDDTVFYYEHEYVQVEKRDATDDTKNKTDYNYESFKAQYDSALKKADAQADTVKYKEDNEEESVQEVVKEAIKIKNCSAEEKSPELSLASIKCYITESKGKKHNLLKKVLLGMVVWIVAYMMVAIPLWCQYGWCCCCCKCKFCNPKQEIDDVKEFFQNNPPGIYHHPEMGLKKYNASPYEVYAQRNLEKALQRL